MRPLSPPSTLFQRRRFPLRTTIWLLAAVTMASAGRSQDTDSLTAAHALETALVDVIAGAEGAVVAVTRDEPPTAPATDPFAPFAPLGPIEAIETDGGDYIPLQFGSGVIVEHPQQPQERFVLTTCHVVFGEEPLAARRPVRVVFRLPDLGAVSVTGTPYAADRRIDLAVCRLHLQEAGILPEQVPALPLGDADSVRKGRLVIALGNPYAMARDGSNSASIGIVSNLARRPQRPPSDGVPRDSRSIHEYGTLLTVDTRLQLGASGGALLDLNGRLIGITTSLAALQGYEKSAGYAIPLDGGTRRIVGDLLNGFEADYGFLGISPETFRTTDADGRAIATVRVVHVAIDSPAADAGLHSSDLIRQINGQPVHDVADLMRLIGLLGPSAEAELLVQRGGDAQTLVARLGKWPVYDDQDILSSASRYPAWRGLSVDYSTARQRFLSSDRLEEYRRAVVVTQVEDGSSAAAAGLKTGDFITHVGSTAVQTPAEFAAAVADLPGPAELKLWSGANVRVVP
ncbi:MAG: trypsin-like peptidase domain-containing protein [Planctomycetaceae bacterium]|nr:trypsin-like peptidase domain-containing protein [Planctomycetaceae bacterium]